MSWPNEPDAFSKVFNGEVAYLPPEEIENLRKGVRRQNKND